MGWANECALKRHLRCLKKEGIKMNTPSKYKQKSSMMYRPSTLECVTPGVVLVAV